jgi:hypothetical protein
VDYSVTYANSTPVVIAGQTAGFALTVSPLNGIFSDPVTLSVPTLPAGMTASFVPSVAVTPGATAQIVTLSIATTAHTTASAPHFPRRVPDEFPWLELFALAWALTGLAPWISKHQMPRFAPQALLALLLVVAAAGLVGCSEVGAGMSSPPKLNPTTGTPAGTYALIVTGTSGGVTHSATVMLTVM